MNVVETLQSGCEGKSFLGDIWPYLRDTVLQLADMLNVPASWYIYLKFSNFSTIDTFWSCTPDWCVTS